MCVVNDNYEAFMFDIHVEEPIDLHKTFTKFHYIIGKRDSEYVV